MVGAEGTNSPRILIVDNENAIRKMLSAAFSRAGYVVRTAANASEAMKLLGIERVDALLSGAALNSISGHDLVRWVATHHPTVTCFLISAYHERDCQSCPFASGCTLLIK